MIELPDFPDCSSEEKELFKLNSIMSTLVAYETEMRVNGMSRAIGVGLESADPGVLGPLNIKMLTELGSTTKLSYGLEAIEWRKIGLAFTGIGIVLSMLIKVYQWVRDRWQGGGSSSTIAAKQRQVAEIKKEMQGVKKELEARLKKHAETPLSEQAFMNIFPDEETPFNLPFKLNLVEHLRSKKISINQAIIAMSRITTIARNYNLYDPAQVGSLILYQATKQLDTTVDMSWVVFCDKLRYDPVAFGERGYSTRDELPTVYNDITVHYVQGMLSVSRAVTEELKILMRMNNDRLGSQAPIEQSEREALHRHTFAMLDRFHTLIADSGFLGDNKLFKSHHQQGNENPTLAKMINDRYLPPSAAISIYMQRFPAIVDELSKGLCIYNPRVANRENEEEWIGMMTIRLTPLQHVLSKFDLDDVIKNHKAVFSSATDAMVQADSDEILKSLEVLKKESEKLVKASRSGTEMLFTADEDNPKYKTPYAKEDTPEARIDYFFVVNSWIKYVSDVTKTLQLYYGTGTRAERGLFRLYDLMAKHK